MYLYSDRYGFVEMDPPGHLNFYLPVGDALAHWNPGLSLVDNVGGRTLLLASDNLSMSYPIHTLGAVSFGIDYLASLYIVDPSLKLTGDMTCEAILMFDGHYVSAVYHTHVSYGGTSTTQAHNLQYSLSTYAGPTNFLYWSEHAAGTDDVVMAPYGVTTYTPHYFAFTRAGALVTLYIDGAIVHAANIANMPDGGTDDVCKFSLGARPSKSSGITGVTSDGTVHHFSDSITARAKSAAEIAGIADQTILRYYE